jgi:hypothetical protein
MKWTNFAHATLAAAGLVAGVPATPALALNTDSYVSSITGSDANTCTITAPCLTMTRALSQTTSTGIFGGVIHCLDSGDYAGATINQTVTIDCANTTAGTSGFIINQGVVHLIGLQIWNGGNALDVMNGGILFVEKCKVFSNGNGIMFEPTASSTLVVSDSYFAQNDNGSVSGGIYIKPGLGATAEVAISNSRVEYNRFGIIADGNAGGIINGTVSNSVIAGNTGHGITASTATSGGANVSLLIDQSQVVGNVNGGLVAGGSNGGMMVRNTSVTGNGVGLQSNRGGGLFSYLNNSVNGNATDGAFTGTLGLK